MFFQAGLIARCWRMFVSSGMVCFFQQRQPQSGDAPILQPFFDLQARGWGVCSKLTADERDDEHAIVDDDDDVVHDDLLTYSLT